MINKNKGLYRSVRNYILLSLLKLTGINIGWGLPNINRKTTVQYYPYSASDIKFPDNYFDRVFCLSVIEHITFDLWEKCIKEFERILKPGGRLLITLDMGENQTNNRQYLRLIDFCSLKLIGNPNYKIPISIEDKNLRHPGHAYETIGLVWQHK